MPQNAHQFLRCGVLDEPLEECYSVTLRLGAVSIASVEIPPCEKVKKVLECTRKMPSPAAGGNNLTIRR